MQSTESNHPTASWPRIVCFPFVEAPVGGSDISALKLIKALDQSRYLPLVAVHSGEGPRARLFRDHGIEVQNPSPVNPTIDSGWKLVIRGVPLIRHLARFLRSRNVAIVHTNDGFTHTLWTLPASLAGARHVWHHRSAPQSRGVRFIAPMMADAVISVSKFATPAWGNYFKTSRCTVLASPFDTDWSNIDRTACRERIIAELGIPESAILLAFVGNLIPRKRPLVFVEAVAALIGSSLEIPVVGLLLGQPLNNLDKEVLKRAEELGISASIRLMGFQSDPERWLAACDCLVVPAVHEPFGRTLIEAMLLGTPVVAAASGGNIEAIRGGETGLLVEPDDPEAFASAIRCLVADTDMRLRLVKTAQSAALRQFSTRLHTDAVMGIYDRILQKDM